jgi:hypothetical protein
MGSLNGKKTRFLNDLTKNWLKNSDNVEIALFIIYNYHIQYNNFIIQSTF